MAKTTKTATTKAAKPAKADTPAPKAAAPAKTNATLRTDADPSGQIFVGQSGKPEYLTLALANRHGLATGATGTGKPVTLQVLAEGFSRAGVPVFAADIKGDLSGIAALGEAREALVQRAKTMDLDLKVDEFSTIFWDVFGEQGHPVRATVSE